MMAEKSNFSKRRSGRQRRSSFKAPSDSNVARELKESNDLLVQLTDSQKVIIQRQAKLISDLETSIDDMRRELSVIEEGSDETLAANHNLRVKISGLLNAQERSNARIFDLEQENCRLKSFFASSKSSLSLHFQKDFANAGPFLNKLHHLIW